jgi:hypothetical protein
MPMEKCTPAMPLFRSKMPRIFYTIDRHGVFVAVGDVLESECIDVSSSDFRVGDRAASGVASGAQIAASSVPVILPF